MAEELGRRLLGEVRELRLDEVLRSLRIRAHASAPPATRLDIVNELFCRERPPQLVNGIPRHPVIEISSEETAAGKSQLLYLIVAVAILPKVHDAIELGGKNSAVVVIDADSRFDVPRLVQIIKDYIRSKSSQSAPIEEELIERSLQHVHLYQPQSMQAMLDVLAELKGYLFDAEAHRSSQRPVHSIIIDNATAFLAQTRANLENEQLAALNAKAPGAGAMPPPKPNVYAQLVSGLRGIQQTLECMVIVTSISFTSVDRNTGERFSRTLPAPWPSFPTLRIVLKREEIRPFAVEISWEDAMRDRKLRQKEVEKGIFVATVSQKDEVLRFCIDSEGVRFSEDAEPREDVSESQVDVASIEVDSEADEMLL